MTDTSPTGHSTPQEWVVTWGVLSRPGFFVEHVLAFDPDEAMTLAAERRPELGPPSAAFPS